ncbi:MAG: lipoyl synthase [Chlamydiae bacterium]|jgi:lipoic acid synthetase|nr:lipoyl synthase [Chlamydiota bacterium]
MEEQNKLNRLPIIQDEGIGRFPKWLHRSLPKGGQIFKTESILNKFGINTVCEEAKCPNRFECYTKKTATFLVMGKACTRACGFCEIDFSKTPKSLDPHEPLNVALSVQELKLKHVVITMVARDDLPDGGAHHLQAIMQKIKEINPESTLEVLTSDFLGNKEAIDLILNEKPIVFNHNVETVRRLTPKVRHVATYERSLEVLKYVKSTQMVPFIKSGIMLGLGETADEVKETLQDLYAIGCDIVTIGHYLQPSRKKLPVKDFISIEQFESYKLYGEQLGIKHVYAGPFVRSSYNADLLTNQALQGASL